MSQQVIDLFSGCGGLSLGFHRAGFQLKAGIDHWEPAVKTVNTNHSSMDFGDATHRAMEIGSTETLEWLEALDTRDTILIGGPPCQAYSKAGKGKLRSLDSQGHLNDPRGQLFWKFIEIINAMAPMAFLMENVPDAWQYGELNVPETVCHQLEDRYNVAWTILNAADYGVPQIRERLFVMGIRKDAGPVPAFPTPTHSRPGQIPPAQKMIPGMLSGGTCPHLLRPPAPTHCTMPWVTVSDALQDLPVLHAKGDSGYHNHRMDESLDYSSGIQNHFQEEIRRWPGFETGKLVDANCYRRTERDFPIFALMQQGSDYREATRIANDLLDNTLRTMLHPGMSTDEQDQIKLAQRAKIVPPYDTEQFFDKWYRLQEVQPSHTVVAHLGTDTYSHIHPWEPRGISVREAARLQSFPDGYRFPGTMGDAFKQIGNAVPPLLAWALAKQIRSLLEN